MTVDKLAAQLDVSEHHLRKIIHKLAKTDYIISTKGRNGGFKLGLSPGEINLGEVLLVTEENMSIVGCMGDDTLCPLMRTGCRLKPMLEASLGRFVEEMRQYTLQDLL